MSSSAAPKFKNPEELEKLKFLDFNKLKKLGQPTHHDTRNTKADQQRLEAEKNQKFKPRKQTKGSDELGSSEYKFYKGAMKDGAMKFNISYIPADSSKPSDELPLFNQTPPGVILSHSFVGLGYKVPKKDIPLNRKFLLTLIFGLYVKDENGNLTDKIQTKGIFSQYYTDLWFVKNPYGRDSDEKRTLEYEVNKFFENIRNTEDQAADFLLNQSDIIDDCPQRLQAILDKAQLFGHNWIEEINERRKEDPSIPKLSSKEWEQTPEYKSFVFPQSKISAIKNIMSSSNAVNVNDERFKIILINSALFDLKHTGIGVGKSDKEREALAVAFAEKFIEDNPDWKERVAVVKFERKVWQPPVTLKNKMDEIEEIKDQVTTKYSQIEAQIKQEDAAITDEDLKLKADKVLADYIISHQKWIYNFPEIYKHDGTKVTDPLHTDNSHLYTKPNYALNPGNMISINFLVNLSVPTSKDTPYGLKFTCFGYILSFTLSEYFPEYKKKINTIDFGDETEAYVRGAEVYRQMMEKRNQKNNESNFASSSSSSSSNVPKFNLNEEQKLKCDFKESAVNEFVRYDSDHEQSNDPPGLSSDVDNDNNTDNEDNDSSSSSSKRSERPTWSAQHSNGGKKFARR